MAHLTSTVDTGHEDMIHDAVLDYYGVLMATCSSDRTVRIYDMKSAADGKHITTLRGHDGPVWQVAWSHPMYGCLLASCSYDRKVLIWKDVGNNSWQIIHTHKEHESSVNSIAWAPHEYGLMLACASSDGSVSILSYKSENEWETKKITNAHTIGVNAVDWVPYISTNVFLEQPGAPKPNAQKKLVTGGCDNLVKIWWEHNGEWAEEQKLEGHSDWVRDVAWAPSVGLSQHVIASCSQDRRVILWHNDGSVNGIWEPKTLHQFDDVVWHLSWSLTGNILAVSCANNKVTLWKETLEGEWVCINNDVKSEGKTATDAVQAPSAYSLTAM